MYTNTPHLSKHSYEAPVTHVTYILNEQEEGCETPELTL